MHRFLYNFVFNFFASFKTGPGAAIVTTANVQTSEALREFFVAAEEDLLALKAAVRNRSEKLSDGARQVMLREVQRRIQNLKGKAALPEVLPVWQMASALEEITYLAEITEKALNVHTCTSGVGTLLADGDGGVEAARRTSILDGPNRHDRAVCAHLRRG